MFRTTEIVEPVQKINRAIVSADKHRRMLPFDKILLWIYIFSFCFDFRKELKGEDVGGSVAQYAMAGICIISSLLFIRGSLFTSRSFRLSNLWWVFIAVIFATTCIYTVLGLNPFDISRFLRLFLPYISFGMSLLIMQTMRVRRYDPREILLPLIISGILSTIWHFFYTVSVRQVTADEGRYNILNGAVPFLIAYCLIEILLAKKVRVLPFVVFFFTSAISAISLARSLFIAFVTVLICIILLAVFSKSRSSLFSLKNAMMVVILGFVMLFTVAAVLNINPQFTEALDKRFNSNTSAKTAARYDTLAMREASVLGMWNGISKNTYSLLFGAGLGATYKWDTTYSTAIHTATKSQTLNPWDSPDHTWFFPFFTNGLLFGWMPIVIFMLTLWSGLKNVIGYIREAELPDYQTYVMPTVALIAYFSESFGANIIGERFSAVIVGLLVGMSLWSSNVISKSIGRAVKDARLPKIPEFAMLTKRYPA